MMELRGKVNHRMIKKAQFGNVHFDEGLNFLSCEIDKSTGQVRLPLWTCLAALDRRLTSGKDVCVLHLAERHQGHANVEAGARLARSPASFGHRSIAHARRRAQILAVVCRPARQVSPARSSQADHAKGGAPAPVPSCRCRIVLLPFPQPPAASSRFPPPYSPIRSTALAEWREGGRYERVSTLSRSRSDLTLWTPAAPRSCPLTRLAKLTNLPVASRAFPTFLYLCPAPHKVSSVVAVAVRHGLRRTRSRRANRSVP